MSPTSDMPRPRAAVVDNPIKIDLSVVKAAVNAEEQAAGLPDTLWFPTTKEDPGRGATTTAFKAGANSSVQKRAPQGSTFLIWLETFSTPEGDSAVKHLDLIGMPGGPLG